MKYELWYSVVVRDRHGKVVSRERRRSRSFIRGWNDTIYVQVTGNNFDSVIAPNSVNLRMTSVHVNGDPHHKSIIVGSGDTPVTISDTGLAARINHGAGAGQLSYQTATVNASTVSAPNCGFIVERAFINNSGAEITVRESGISLRVKGVSFYTFVLGVRDVLVTPQAIPNGGTLSESYTLRVTA
ncbi:hypothetical protein ES703_106913 [subsurface metagenome]